MKNAELMSLCKNREDILSACQQEVAKLKAMISGNREEFYSLNDECADLKGLLEQKMREVEHKKEDLKALKVWMMALMLQYTMHFITYVAKPQTVCCVGFHPLAGIIAIKMMHLMVDYVPFSFPQLLFLVFQQVIL